VAEHQSDPPERLPDHAKPPTAADLPGNPQNWREFRVALKRLIGRAELTASAIERISNEPRARQRGSDGIADATVGRKIADKEAPVDARSTRIIVLVCEIALRSRGEPIDVADLSSWLAVRTALAEHLSEQGEATSVRAADDVPPTSINGNGATVPDTDTPSPIDIDPVRRGLSPLVIALLAVVVAAAGAVVWTAGNSARDQTDLLTSRQPAATTSARSAAAVPDLAAGQNDCRNPPDVTDAPGLELSAPTPGQMITSDSTAARGSVQLAPGERPPWLLLYAVGECRYYVEAPVIVAGNGDWSGTLYLDPTQHGAFAIYVAVVSPDVDRQLRELVAGGGSPSLARLPPDARVVHAGIRCCA